jgi:hypothetical protein
MMLAILAEPRSNVAHRIFVVEKLVALNWR